MANSRDAWHRRFQPWQGVFANVNQHVDSSIYHWLHSRFCVQGIIGDNYRRLYSRFCAQCIVEDSYQRLYSRLCSQFTGEDIYLRL